MLVRGAGRSEVIQYLQDHEGLGYLRARQLYRLAVEELTEQWHRTSAPSLRASLLSTSLAQARAAQEAGDAAGAAAHLAMIAQLAKLNG